ncbi:fibronectin type III domain-containing protein [Fredinandcohnia onubensis]|uniref:fibronectin type III domain-containing protein n=1 Tax=Fredinandcohnia onubensis TaxID=1571209 RepID=UPI000C0BF868|nr:fibronectin type III domain-containing protein [Fredinandcohnia onubensis]
MRRTRLRKFGKRGRKLALLAQIAAIWYLSFVMVAYLTSDTGAYFNDVETISETIIAAPDFCAKEKGPKSDYQKKFCNDNAGGGNGCDPADDCDEEDWDPDNPGQNPISCDDHTSAPCSEAKTVTKINATPTSNSIKLTWANPTGNNFGSINIYRGDDTVPIGANITNGEFVDTGLEPNSKYVYKLRTVHKNSKTEKTEQVIEVTTISVETEETTEKTKEDSAVDPTENTSEDEEIKTDKEPPAEVSGLSIGGNGANLTLAWTNPSDSDFAFVRVYIDEKLMFDKLTVETVDYKNNGNEKITIKITTMDTFGNESTGESLTVN